MKEGMLNSGLGHTINTNLLVALHWEGGNLSFINNRLSAQTSLYITLYRPMDNQFKPSLLQPPPWSARR